MAIPDRLEGIAVRDVAAPCGHEEPLMQHSRTGNMVGAIALSILLGACQATAVPSPSTSPQQTIPEPTRTAKVSATHTGTIATPVSTATPTAEESTAGSDLIDGVYATSFTWAELLASPFLVAGENGHANWGDWQLSLADGQSALTQANEFESSTSSGSFEIDGDSITLTNGSETLGYRWSMVGDVLTFSRDDSLGLPGPTPFLVKPWKRVDPSAPPLVTLAAALSGSTGDRVVFYPAGDTYWPPRAHMINADGTNEVALAERGSMPGVPSPDGTKIALLRFVDYDLAPPIKNYWTRAALMNPDGSGLRVLDGYPGQHNLVPIGWTADGASLYVYSGFDAAKSDEMGTFSVRASDGGAPLMVLPAPVDSLERPDFVQVSPDGKQLLVNRQKKGADGNDFLFDISTSQLKQINPTGTVSCEMPGGSMSIGEAGNIAESWSPDGAMVAFCGFVTAADGSALYVARRDGSGARQIVPPSVGGVSAQWSPDGKWIAFTSRLRSAPQVWIVRPDGSGLTQLTNGADGSTSVGPKWSPDGSRLLFVRQMASQGTLWIMNADGRAQSRLTATPVGNEPAGPYAWWSAR